MDCEEGADEEEPSVGERGRKSSMPVGEFGRDRG